ncbi:YpsA SLOG family protein, partial [Staphylococcus aureus]
MKLKKVISGGQTGADQAGLRAGKAAGLETGGMVPKGCLTDDG